MRKLITFICLLYCWIGYAQLPNEIKHVEIISEVTDTMALLNKKDIDKINTVFFRLECADSLNKINEKIISNLNTSNLKLENIISEQKLILDNKDVQISQIKEQSLDVISDLEKQVKRSNAKKTFWEGTSALGVIAIIFLAIF